MAVPQLVYELQPYAYLGSGVGLLTTQQHWILIACGALLFGAGALVWCLRSINRRKDTYKDKINLKDLDFYELKPFILLLLGFILLSLNLGYWYQAPAMLCCVVGAFIWSMRYSRRHVGQRLIKSVKQKR